MAAIPSTYERRWPAVILTPITVANHKITVSSVNGLHTKQKITLRLGANVLTDLEIKRILSDTEIQVGPIGGGENGQPINPVAFNGGTLESQEQERNKIGNEYTFRAVYEEEPAVALRNVLVDRYGSFYSTSNPMPVQLSNGSINIGSVNAELEVQLSHLDDDPDTGDVHDSVRIGDGTYLAGVTDANRLKVEAILVPAPGDESAIKEDLLCAEDVHIDYTWADVDGVRRISKIEWTSPLTAADYGYAAVKLTRDFTYQGVDPFDLIDRQDTLLLTP